MKKRLLTSNYYITTIDGGSSIDSLSDSGSFVVATKTVEGYTIADGEYIFYVTVDFGNVNKREIFRIYKVVGTTLYYNWRKSSAGPKQSHISGAIVQLNDVSEALNYISANVDDIGMVEIIDTSTNAVRFKGGWVTKSDGTSILLDDAILPVASGVNTVIYNFATSSVEVVTNAFPDHYYKFATVVSNGTYPTAITDIRSMFIGFDTTAITPTIEVNSVTTGPAGSDAIVTNSGTSLHAKFNFTIPRGAPGEGSQNIDSTIAAPYGATVTTDNATYIQLVLLDNTKTIYQLDGIFRYDASNKEISRNTTITGTFDELGIKYTDGSSVDKITGVRSFIGNPAYLNSDNDYMGVNVFNMDTIFKGSVSFPYIATQGITGDIVFDGLVGDQQAFVLVHNEAPAHRAIHFINLMSGRNYQFVIVTAEETELSLGTVTESADITQIYTIRKEDGSSYFPITASGPDVHVFAATTYNTAIHISYIGVSRSDT